MSEKVIRLRNDAESVQQLEHIIELLKQNKIDAMVLMAYEPQHDKQKQEEENSLGKIYRYWFAQNGIGCLNCLGLMDYSKYIIRKFMLEDIDIVRGDYDNLTP